MDQPDRNNFALATCNMSLPVMLALLARLHDQLAKTDKMAEAAQLVEQAIDVLFDVKQDDEEAGKLCQDSPAPTRH